MERSAPFERIWCINLDSRGDKWAFVEPQFKKLGWRVERFPAVDGRQVDLGACIRDRIVQKWDRSRGALGCLLSHYQIYKQIQATDCPGDRWFLILEDDVHFPAPVLDRPSLLDDYLRAVPDEAVLVKWTTSVFDRAPRKRVNDLVYVLPPHSVGQLSTTAYMVRRCYVDTVLASFPTDTPIDLLMATWRLHHFVPLDPHRGVVPDSFYLDGCFRYYGLVSSHDPHSVSDTMVDNVGEQLDRVQRHLDAQSHREACELLELLHDRSLERDSAMAFRYFHLSTIAWFYHDRARGVEVGREWIRRLSTDPGVRSLTLSRRENVLNNFDFYGLREELERALTAPRAATVQHRDGRRHLVTALFDLGRRENNLIRRQVGEYVRHGQELLTALGDTPLTIYCDPELASNFSPRDNLTVVPVKFEELETYRLLPSLLEALRIHPRQNLVGDYKTSTFYYIMTWSKFELLRRTMQSHAERYSHYAWIDIGLAHVLSVREVAKLPLSDDVRILQLAAIFADEFADPVQYFGHVRMRVAGGYFQGSRSRMLELCDLFSQTLHGLLARKIAGLEECILAYLLVHHPQLFSPCYGDYGQIIKNFEFAADNLQMVLNIVVQYRTRSHHLGMLDVLSHFRPPERFAPLLLLQYYDELFIANYYLGREREAHEAAQNLLRLARTIPAVGRNVLERIEHFKSNLSFCPHPRDSRRNVGIRIRQERNVCAMMQYAHRRAQADRVTVYMDGPPTLDSLRPSNPLILGLDQEGAHDELIQDTDGAVWKLPDDSN